MEWYNIKRFVIDLFYPKTYRFLWQKITRGWDDSDTWSLDYTLAKWILPRLKRFKQLSFGCPTNFTEKQWDEMIDEMIWAFDYIANDRENEIFTENGNFEKEREEWKKAEDRCDKGLELFGKYMRGLWW
jgi:hypothetical protein